MTIVEAFQSECKGAALHEMEFMKKSWREDDENGDDIEMHGSRAQGPQQSRSFGNRRSPTKAGYVERLNDHHEVVEAAAVGLAAFRRPGAARSVHP
ncbi:MAG TPA: hypothetical protein P5234_08235 [Thermoanaerobaculaceae bacterium]|nr:hypothetical protein [Thermoanaerobaculaceae bacterium]HRS16225.1 hypothetical protein [Thermoanaerobaculaceae bacterium]